MERKNARRAKGYQLFLQIRDYLFSSLLVLICLFILFGTKAHKVEGPSMNDTLATGDRILIHKGQRPERYDIVTFTPKSKAKESYVKRVIGLPGDWIYVNQTTAYLFGKEKPAIKEGKELSEIQRRLSYEVVQLKQWGAGYYQQGLTQIPADAYFLRGDNAENSQDSRDFGFVTRQQLEGVLWLRFYPFQKIGRVH